MVQTHSERCTEQTVRTQSAGLTTEIEATPGLASTDTTLPHLDTADQGHVQTDQTCQTIGKQLETYIKSIHVSSLNTEIRLGEEMTIGTEHDNIMIKNQAIAGAGQGIEAKVRGIAETMITRGDAKGEMVKRDTRESTTPTITSTSEKP